MSNIYKNRCYLQYIGDKKYKCVNEGCDRVIEIKDGESIEDYVMLCKVFLKKFKEKKLAYQQQAKNKLNKPEVVETKRIPVPQKFGKKLVDAIKNGVVSSSTEKRDENMVGPGTELKKIFETLGFRAMSCGGCRNTLIEMNKNGAEWCRNNIKTIVEKIERNKNEQRVGMIAKLKAGAIALREGLPLTLEGLVLEAIERDINNSKEKAINNG